MNKLILKLKRQVVRNATCDGALYSESGIRICDTAEATQHMLEPGEYVLKQGTRLLQRGNGIHNLRSPAVLVGSHLVPGVVKNSAQAYARLYQRIKKARQRGHDIVLIVTADAASGS